MEGQVFALDIIRDFGFGIATKAKKERIARDEAASIKKLAAHYLKSGRAANMEEATHMAASILR